MVFETLTNLQLENNLFIKKRKLINQYFGYFKQFRMLHIIFMFMLVRFCLFLCCMDVFSYATDYISEVINLPIY